MMRGRGASRGRGGFSGRGGFNSGPPAEIAEMGLFMHPCEGEMVCQRSPAQSKIPYFNAPIFLENKTQIGKVDEILGPMTEVYFTVKLDHGVVASSFKVNDKVYIGTDKLLPLERFLPKPAIPGGKAAKPGGLQGQVSKPSRGRGGGRGGGRGRGGPSRGRGAPRGFSGGRGIHDLMIGGRGVRGRGRGGY